MDGAVRETGLIILDTDNFYGILEMCVAGADNCFVRILLSVAAVAPAVLLDVSE